jgi:hypothetical protein
MSDKGFTITPDRDRHILQLKVWGFWSNEDAEAFKNEFREKAKIFRGEPWYVLADIVDWSVQAPEVQAIVQQSMVYARNNGMEKAANIVSKALGKMQIKRMSESSALYFGYFDSEEKALAWLFEEEA